MRKLIDKDKSQRIGKAGHEGENYAALAEGYGISRNAVAKHVHRYRLANGLPQPRKEVR